MEGFIMKIILLIIIYICFIGLGIPDSLLGTAWPAIYKEFELPVSAVSYISLLISTCTIISSLLSAKVINKFGTSKVTEYGKNIKREFAPWFQGIHFSHCKAKRKKKTEG